MSIERKGFDLRKGGVGEEIYHANSKGTRKMRMIGISGKKGLRGEKFVGGELV